MMLRTTPPARSFTVEDMTIALDFLEGEAEPLCGDLFEAVGFLRLLVEDKTDNLRRQWPEWFTFYADRTGQAWCAGSGVPA